MYFNKKGKINTHTDPCASILPFLLKYMYQARKVISVYIDLSLLIEVHVHAHTDHFPGSVHIYVNKKGKIDTHTDHFPGLVHVLL
jgi:hypothetical protein